MKYNFQKFVDTETSFAARITIRKTGQLGFNNGSLNNYSIKNYDFCVLYYDSDKKVIGIEMSNRNQQGAIELKKSEANTFLRAKNFLDRFDIDYKNSHRYQLKRDNESNLLYFELNEELTKDFNEDDNENIST